MDKTRRWFLESINKGVDIMLLFWYTDSCISLVVSLVTLCSQYFLQRIFAARTFFALQLIGCGTNYHKDKIMKIN